jgi:hypothetical protein
LYGNLEQQMLETKNHTGISKELWENEREVDSKVNKMQLEMIKLRQELIVESFCILEEKLEARLNEMLDKRLGQSE